MPGDVVNLRMARKRRNREAKARLAEENRAAFGQSKSERDARSIDRSRAERLLDGHVREAAPDGEETGGGT